LAKAKGFRCALISWPKVEAWVDAIIKRMRAEGFSPEIVIGMSRGGIVPSRLICDHLVVKNLFTVKTEHWGLTATPDGKARLAQALHADISGRRVLVVDDITDTGQSLLLAKEHVAALHPGALKTATLLHITHSLITPDYYAHKVEKDEWTWFIFPWNVREDMRNILVKALEEPATLVELKANLKDNYLFEPSDEIIRETLGHLISEGKVSHRGHTYEARSVA
jgi:hypoxanthine phosphoribosyltransferase